MSQNFLSVLEGIGNDCKNVKHSGNGIDKEESEGEEDQSEVEATVEDLLSIKNKEILKRNLTVVVKENLTLKRKVKMLETKFESQQQNDQHLSFHVDTTGNNDTQADAADILYHENSELLTGLPEKEEVEEEKKTRPKNTCFNCLGDHMIADCKEPKDQRKIAKNRKEFQKTQVSYNSSRYHEDEPQKFGKLEPGLPSTRLREALGLRSHQLPEYIYKMRHLGYPPGWMRHAEVSTSGMHLYKAFGEKLGHHGDEDGEVADPESRTKYDINKLKEWPGFNISLPTEYKDETAYYRVPPITKHMMLQEMIEQLKPRQHTGYKRRKMQKVETSRDNHNQQDMDMDSDTQDDPCPPGEEADVIDISSSPKDSGGDVEDDKDGDKNVSDKAVSIDDVTGDVRCDVKSTPSRSVSTISSSGSVSKTEPGTPILELYSPFESVPKMDSFAKDSTDHILFENLPNYTGKWEEMSGLIKTIRKRKSAMEKDDDKDY